MTLTKLMIERGLKSGKYPDGGGLYLQVSKSGTKSWLFRYRLYGRTREMGLGRARDIDLREARIKALDCRRMVLDGIDPISERDARLKQAALEVHGAKTFNWCAEQYIVAHQAGWKNKKHAQQWRNTLKTYAGPVIGDMPVHVVDTEAVMRVLQSIWYTKTETATRVRSRIELILSWATVSGYRMGQNPAQWRGHLSMKLPRRTKVQKPKHHAALPFDNIPAFMVELRAQRGIAAKALEFTILNADRTIEVRGAQWSEFDLKQALWIIPPARIKTEVEHRVPLAPRSLEILQEMREFDFGPYVFPGGREGRPLSENAMLKLLERMGYKRQITVHGFRSTFRDWVAHRTNYSDELAEKAIAHQVRDKTQAAYQRGDLLEKRRRMMEEWATFCVSKTYFSEAAEPFQSRIQVVI